MSITFLMILCGILLIWLSVEIRGSEKSAMEIYPASGLKLSFDPEEMGSHNGPMDNVFLDRGVSLRKNEDGKFEIIPTAKNNSEYQ